MLVSQWANTLRRQRGAALMVAAATIGLAGLLATGPRPVVAESRETNGDQMIDYGDELLIQLAVSDLEKAIAFYRDILELKLETHDQQLEWAKFDTNVPGVQIGIGRQDTVTGSGSTSINISMGDVDSARALLESRGVTFPRPSVNIPGVVKLADFTDLDGNRLRLAGPPDAAADADP